MRGKRRLWLNDCLTPIPHIIWNQDIESYLKRVRHDKHTIVLSRDICLGKFMINTWLELRLIGFWIFFCIFGYF